MSLSAALYAGVSGLDVNQTQMNVIGNNIANANTVAFKSSTAQFTSQAYVTDAAGSPTDGNFGGTNPEQLGLGAQVSSVTQDFSQGQIETTGVDTDLAVSGNGFFVVQNSTSGQQFTRDGSFTLNSNKDLVNSDGDTVMGYGVDSTGTVIPGKLQAISIPVGSETIAKATTTASLTGNLAADGNVSTGSSVLDTQALTTAAGTAPTAATLLSSVKTASSGAAAFTVGQVLTLGAERDGSDLPAETLTVTATTTVGNLQTFFNNSLGIDTSVAGTGTNIVAGATPGTAFLQITGNAGSANALTVPTAGFSDASGNTPLTFTDDATSDPAGEGTSTQMTLYDSLGQPVNVNITTALETKTDTGTTWKFYATSADNEDASNPGGTLIGTGTLTFNTAGVLQTVSGGDLNIHRSETGAQPNMPVELDFTGMSALAQDSAHTGSEMEMSNQDGIQIGTLTSYSVGGDGTITGSFDNGLTRTVGQVALATFSNDNGLVSVGNNKYAAAANSGSPVIGIPSSLGSGTIQAGALEESNVDLSAEFTAMIISSTGFSAASKVITTSDQMLTELLNTSQQ
jgi:flagellar hook protein FlgE